MKNFFIYDKEALNKMQKTESFLHLGTLSRKNSLLCLRMQKELEKLLDISKNFEKKLPRLILAVSAGIDSISMLAIFLALQKKYPYSLHVAHFNHGIRKESEDEKIIVEDFCNFFHLDYHYEKADIPQFAKEKGLGLEEASRIKRYAFLEKTRAKVNADFICIAHHAQDLAEDIFMRLCRGAVWPALGGMSAVCHKRKILRPLLHEDKNNLINFAKDLTLPFSYDISNDDKSYLRNRVRSNILPFFLNENPNFLDNIENIHNCAKLDEDFFQEYIKDFCKKNASYNSETSKVEENSTTRIISVPLIALINTHKALRLRIYHHILSIQKNTFTQNTKLAGLDNAVMKKKGKSIFEFSKNTYAKIEKGSLHFIFKSPAITQTTPF